MYYIVDKIRRSGDPIKSRANSLSRTKAGAKIPQSSEGTTRPEKLCVAEEQLLRGVSTSRLSAQSILLPNPLRLSARPPRPLFFLLTTTAQILAVTKQQSSRWSISARRSASRPRSSAAASARSGSTPTRSVKSPTPTPARPSASSSAMASSSASPSPCTRDPAPAS
ncbi:hypothetical protein GGS24DRAFT_25391 [Hypoxylon argillaceum]|nr:hypothetical protein GGS24DRAFT_25391 [Hypoxylon argillaceum]